MIKKNKSFIVFEFIFFLSPNVYAEVLDKIPHHVGVLLTILAASNLDEPQEAEMIGAFDREGIKELVLSSIDEIARRREISRFRAFC